MNEQSGKWGKSESRGKIFISKKGEISSVKTRRRNRKFGAGRERENGKKPILVYFAKKKEYFGRRKRQTSKM